MAGAQQDVGGKIREFRLNHAMTLKNLADKSSISVAALENIEDNRVSPPLGHIISIARALDVPVGELFGDSGDSPFAIVRSTDRPEVARFESGGGKVCGYTYAGLGQQKRNRQMEPFLVTLDPAEADKVVANQHIGEEFIFVLEGAVKVSLLDHTDILGKGDSIYYDSNIPHIVSCHGSEPATILAVIYAKEEMIIL